MRNRILIVDDEENIRKLLSEFLSEEGHQVTVAANGEEALVAFQKNPFPLIITDIFMGEMNGLELLKEIKSLNPDSSVIVMTSQASLETAMKAYRAGAYDYLLKPFENLDFVSAVVSRALEKIRLVNENKRLMGHLKRDAEELDHLNRNLKEMVNRDGLTGLYNRRWFHDALENELARCIRYQRIFSIIFIDLDHFKEYNDTHGHLAGDEILKTIGKIFMNETRATTAEVRYGGEEFILMALETDREGARKLAERIRKVVEDYPFEGRETQPMGRLTLSLGIATFPENGKDSTTLLDNADQALYQAKHEGRNKVCG